MRARASRRSLLATRAPTRASIPPSTASSSSCSTTASTSSTRAHHSSRGSSRGAPHLRVLLAPSLRVLGVEGEQVWPLEPLDIPPAEAAADPDSMLEFRRSSPLRGTRSQRTPRLRDHCRERRRGSGDRPATRRPTARDRTRSSARAPEPVDLAAPRRSFPAPHRGLAACRQAAPNLARRDRMELRAARRGAGGPAPAFRVRGTVRTRRGNRRRPCRRRG